MSKVAGFILGVLLCIILSVALVTAIAWPISAAGCHLEWRDSEREYRVRALTCQVHDGRGWVPASRVRVD